MSDFLSVRDAATATAIVWVGAPIYAATAQGQVRAACPALAADLDALTANGGADPWAALVARQWRIANKGPATTGPIADAWPAIAYRLDDLARAVTARDGTP